MMLKTEDTVQRKKQYDKHTANGNLYVWDDSVALQKNLTPML